MNLYYAFYCRAYDWYNTSGKKSIATLRGSAIVLLSAMPLINILTVIGLIGYLNKHTPLNEWIMVALVIGLLIMNWQLISFEKSEALRDEYSKYSTSQLKRINFWFYFYIVFSVLLLTSMLILTAWYKSRYGNYDA